MKGISVDAAGNFSTSLASPLEYGDTLSTIVFARSKTSTDYIQSSPSADQSVNWSIQPVTNVVANAGSTQLSGKASQVSNGTYQVKVQINGGSIYTTSLDSNGTIFNLLIYPLSKEEKRSACGSKGSAIALVCLC